MGTPIQETMGAIEDGTIVEFQGYLAQYPHLIAEFGPELIEHAAGSNRVDLLPILVAKGVSVNAVSLSSTPLYCAAKSGALEAAKWLLDHGAEIDRRAEPSASTPLNKAIIRGQLAMVKYLLTRGADPQALNGNPARNAVAAAMFWSQSEIVEFLESRGLSAVVIEPKPVDVESPKFALTNTTDPVQWYDAKWWHTYDYCEKHGLEAMSKRNQTLFLIGYLINQLRDGGAGSVYSNPSGRYAIQMADALDRIGAERVGQVMRDLNSLFPGGAPVADDFTRQAQLSKLPLQASALGLQLNRILDETVPSRGAPTVLCQLYDYYLGT